MNNTSEYSDILPLFEGKDTIHGRFTPEICSDTVVIYPPTIDWNWMKQRPQQLMEQFSLHGYRVYYCNKTQSETELYSVLNPNLYLVHNNQYLIHHILPNLKKKGIKIVLWVSWSKLHVFLDDYLPDFVIYDYLDDFAAWKPYLPDMVEKANVIITTSNILERQIMLEYPDKPCTLIPNGCDMDHFKPAGICAVPMEFAQHKGPIITYCGAWAQWIDRKLVEEIAQRYKDVMIAIIGVEFGASANMGIPNIKYLGYKSYDELPAYLRASTVCIIPFLLEEVTLATNPIKMYEYLAAGKPVVSTDLPEARNAPGVFIGKSHEAFLGKLQGLLDGQLTFDSDTVYPWLAQHTWETRFKAIQGIMEEYDLPASAK